MGKNAEYAEQYKDAAMEQMRRYGIPASVTLAQGILESSNGQSELSQLGNNHFGIKATKGWLAAGGGYLVYTDDRPNEKFCKYDSVADSMSIIPSSLPKTAVTCDASSSLLMTIRAGLKASLVQAMLPAARTPRTSRPSLRPTDLIGMTGR